jgi:hypothetical protein
MGQQLQTLLRRFCGCLLVSRLAHHSVTRRCCLFIACLSCPFRFPKSWPYRVSPGTRVALLRYQLRQMRVKRGSKLVMRLRVLIQGQDGATVAGRHTGGRSLGTSTGSYGGNRPALVWHKFLTQILSRLVL